MKTDDFHLQENTERLMRAAMGDEARLSPKVRSQMLAQLARHLRQQRPVFPDSALALLGSLAAIVAMWWIVRGLPLNALTPALAAQQLMRFVGILNLIVIPFAGLVIIMRRRGDV